MSGATAGVVEVYLVRHGQTWLNGLDRAQGWCDSPLTGAGRELAAALGRGLAADGVVLDAAYSGDMSRHDETARGILDVMGSSLPVTRLRALREMSFVGWEGGPNADMWRACWDHSGVAGDEEAFARGLTLVDVYDGISASNPDTGYPAEDTATVAERAVGALRGIVETEAGRREHSRVLVVSSGITIVCLLDALGLAPRTRVRNGAVALLRRDASGWSAVAVNDMSWAEAGRATGRRAAMTSTSARTTGRRPAAGAVVEESTMTEDKGSVEIYLVRHGETWFNKLDRVQGWCGTPLTPKGFAVAEAIGRAFAQAGIDFTAAYCADMLRHHETMASLLAGMGSRLRPISRFGLREMSFGAWEGMPNNLMWEAAYRVLGVTSMQEALDKGYTLIDIYDVFSRTNPDTDYPSDNVGQAADRALAALDEIAVDEAAPDGTPKVLVVSSGGTIACIVDRLGARLTTPIHNGGVSRLLRDRDGSWALLGCDDVSWAERGGWQG